MLLLISTTSPPTHRDHPPNGRVCAQWDPRATHSAQPTPTTEQQHNNTSTARR